MQSTTLTFKQSKTYLSSTLFVVGNILLPQLFHSFPQGGTTWLPIFFFTLVGASVYGWRVGLLTALASPLLSSMLFGMPAVAALPAIVFKSVLLAVAAGLANFYFKNITFGLLVAVVVVYQGVATLAIGAMSGNFFLAFDDFRIGIPGMLLQIFGGYFVIRFLVRNRIS